MFLNRLPKVNALVFVVVSIFLFGTCKNDLSEIGININPDASELNQKTLDSFQWICTSSPVDSFATNNLSSFLLGTIQDPYFGVYSASIVGQARLASLGRGFTDTSQLDSIVLYLVIDNNDRFIGDSNINIDLKVFEITEDLDSVYYSNTKLSDLSQIGTYSGPIFSNDSSIRIFAKDTITTSPTLKIKLDPSFGNKLMDKSNENKFEDNTVFTEFIKGIALIPDENQLSGYGGIASIDLRNFYSEIVVYFDSIKSKSLIFSNYSKLGNLYTIKNQPAQLTQQFEDTVHFEETYMQGLGGSQIKISIPNLTDSLVKFGQNIVINQASLTLQPKEGFESSNFPLPKRLNLFSLDSAGNRRIIEDFFTNSLGGTLNENENNYTFMITREIQKILNDLNFQGVISSKRFVVSIPSDNPLEATRMVLDSRKNIGIKLTIRYTLLE